MRTNFYRILRTIHLALVTEVGLLVLVLALLLFSDHSMLKPITLVFFVAYVVCDRVRLHFLRGTTVSLGFPLIFLTLLTDSPLMALVVATLGSWFSEVLQSRLSKQRLLWFPTLRRAFFYTGHHALAGFGALIAYQFIHTRLPPWLLEEILHIQAILAYIIVYSLISMFLIWPHDRRGHLFSAPDERPFVRVDFLTTLLLLPLPASVFCLYNLNLGQTAKILIVVGVLPPLFLLLSYLARKFAKMAKEQERLALREKISQRLGSPANMAEMVERILTTMGQLLDYRWGAVYNLVDGELKLYGEKPHKGPVVILDQGEASETGTPSTDTSAKENQVVWPLQVKLDEGILGKLATIYFPVPPRFFDRGRARVTSSDPYLPPKTALLVYPIIAAEPQRGKEGAYQLIGLIALARPREPFTTWDSGQGLALSSIAGDSFLNLQRVRELLLKVQDYAQNQEEVHHAMHKLVFERVEVDKILAAVSDHVFHENPRTVLQCVVEGKGDSGISVTSEMLTKMYNQVRSETAEPVMPDLDSGLLELLQRVTSSLSPAFSFCYQSPDAAREPAFKAFCDFLLAALDASTVSDIVAQGPIIERTTRDLKLSSLADRDKICEQLEQFQKIVALLEEAEDANVDTKMAYLSDASQSLRLAKQSAQNELEDPEQFTFMQVAATWQTVVTNALYAVQERGAQLIMALSSNWALPLEEVTIQLRLENRGPGLASRVVAEIQPSQGYQVGGDERIDVGPMPADSIRKLDFRVKPNRRRDTLFPKFLINYHDRERKVMQEEVFVDRVHLHEDLMPFTKIEKVYVVGPALEKGSSLFFGREDIFKFVRDNITAPTTTKPILLLVATRRMGKTSILKQLSERLKGESYVHVFVDCQRIVGGMVDFFWRLSDAISEGLKAAGLSFEGLSPVDFEDQPQFVFEKEFLPRVWECIGDRSLLLAIDEFEALYGLVRKSQLKPETFSYLRSLMQSQKMAFVLVGTPQTEELVTHYESAFFNLAKFRRVSFLEREEALQLITQPVCSYGMVYDDLALDEILHLTACQPYFLQLVCDCLVDHCNEKERNYVTIQDVRDVRNRIIEQGRPHLRFVWQQSSPSEKAVLSALVSLLRTQQQVTVTDIVEHLNKRLGNLADRVNFDSLAITRALEQLTDRDIIQGSETPGAPRSYAFTAHLYCEWISKYKSLDRIGPELIEKAV